MSREGGQAMVETILVFPLLLVVLLATVQLAELVVTLMAANWAARMAARVVAVQMNDDADQPMEKAEAAALQILVPFLPPVPLTGDIEAKLPPVIRWVTRAGLYNAASLRSLTLTGHIEFKSGDASLEDAPRFLQKGERGNAVVELELWYPLRIPLGNRFFADASVTTSTVRKITARAQFPVMYAPVKNEK